MSDTGPITVRVPVEVLEELEKLAVKYYPQAVTGRQGSKGFDLSKMTNDVLREGIKAITDGQVSFPSAPKAKDDLEARIHAVLDTRLAEVEELLEKLEA